MVAGSFEAQQQPASRLLLLRAQRRGRRLDETSALLARDAVLVPIEPSVVAHRDVVELRAALEGRHRRTASPVVRAQLAHAVRIPGMDARAVFPHRSRSARSGKHRSNAHGHRAGRYPAAATDLPDAPRAATFAYT